jgi:hypothetical protein
MIHQKGSLFSITVGLLASLASPLPSIASHECRPERGNFCRHEERNPCADDCRDHDHDHGRRRDHGHRHDRRPERGSRILEYSLNQIISGRNRVHLNEMFSLSRSYRGLHLERIEVFGNEEAPTWETSSTLDLVNEYGEQLARKTFSGRNPIVFRPSHNHLGEGGTHYDLIVDGSIYIGKIVVVVSSDCDHGNPPSDPTPPTHSVTYSLEAQIEGHRFEWNSESRYQIYSSCVASVSARRINSIDSIRVLGSEYRNGAAYWSKQAACALISLMATPQTSGRHTASSLVLSATLDDVTPIRMYALPRQRETTINDLKFLLGKISTDGGFRSVQLWTDPTDYPRWGSYSSEEVFNKLRSAIRSN